MVSSLSYSVFYVRENANFSAMSGVCGKISGSLT